MTFRQTILILTLCICLLLPWPSRGERHESQEYALKAAFLYNFILFTEWPESVGPTLKLCTYGRDPFGQNLDKLKGKTAGVRTIAIYRATRLSELKDCQVVFISASAIEQLDELHNALKGRAVLTVADTPTSTMGIAINMFTCQNKISFDINLAATRNAGLSVSSKLLKLAEKVSQ